MEDTKHANKSSKKEKNSNVNCNIKSRRLSLITIMILVIVGVTLIIGIIFGFKYIFNILKYGRYIEKMNTYGLNELYNNKKANTFENVTNSEMLKVVIGCIKNERNSANIHYIENPEYTNEAWVEYATITGINLTINKDNENFNTTYAESIITAVNAVESILGVKIEKSQLNLSKDVLSKYTEDQREALAKAVTLNLIDNKNSSIDNSELIKGKLNKLVITLVEKYATMYYNTSSVNNENEIIKNDVNVVLDDKLKPSNYKDYPYIVDSITNEEYQMEKIIRTEMSYKSPSETYKKMNDVYEQTDEMIAAYLRIILNVDYNKITEKKFLESIENLVTYKITKDDVKEYVAYVKKNKIKIEGTSRQLLPIIYFDGEQYVVRTNITFKILNSNTTKNILFGDEGKNIEYNGKEFSIYVDLPMGQTINSNSLRIYIDSFADHIVSKNSKITIKE